MKVITYSLVSDVIFFCSIYKAVLTNINARLDISCSTQQLYVYILKPYWMLGF